MPSVIPVVYNDANLLLWKSELPLNEQQKSENLRILEEQAALLRPYKEQLRSVEVLISSAKNQLLSANIRADQDMMHHMHGHHHHHHHGMMHFMDDALRHAAIASLESELSRLQVQRARIMSQMQPYEIKLNQAQANLNQLQSRYKWLMKHIPAGDLFLQKMYLNPGELVVSLTNDLLKTFSEYEDTHLIGLSPQVRINLIAVRYGFNTLLSSPIGLDPDQTNTVHRINYLRLTGFLWDMYNRVSQEKKDAQFEKILGTLIESTHILENGDLPDYFQTHYSAAAWFQESKINAPGYFAIPQHNLPGIEEDILNNGLAMFSQNSLYQRTGLQNHVVNVAKLIDEEVKMKKQKNEDVDYHFYGRTVRILGEVFHNPNDAQAAKRLGDIAEYASGNGSVGKQILGGLLIVLGVLLIGASIAGFVATLGSSSILSSWGFALGLGLFEAEIVLGVASTVAAVTGIGLTFFSGPNTIRANQRQGLSQELMDIKEEVENYDRPPAYGAMVM